jgi:hypothetical protein
LIPGEECCSFTSSSVPLSPHAQLFTWPYPPPFLLGLNSNNHYLRYCHNSMATRVVVLHSNDGPFKSRRKVGCAEQQIWVRLANFRQPSQATGVLEVWF